MLIWKKHVDIYDELALVDSCIRKNLKSNLHILNDTLSDLLANGGKRLRPALVLLSAQFGNYDRDKLVPLASAIEIMHMATLVHDDVIDDARLRRGRPTTRSRFGNDVAVFTGDFLFTKAFTLISQSTTPQNMHLLAVAIKAICEGEIEQYESRFKPSVSVRHYLKRIARKTAVLFELSSYVGAVEAGCSKQTSRLLRKLGFDFGMAFQITDDILDFTGQQAVVGKPLCSDFRQGVYTLPVIYTAMDPRYSGEMHAYMQKDDLTEEDIAGIGRLVEQSGGLKYAKELAMTYLDRCRSYLDQLPDMPAKGAIEELLEELVERKY